MTRNKLAWTSCTKPNSRDTLTEQKRWSDNNLNKAYALIFSTYCNKTMQDRIEEHPDYENTIRDDQIELLSKIKVLMHDPIRAKYPYASSTEAMIRILNIKQIENEGLLDYVKRFKETRDPYRNRHT